MQVFFLCFSLGSDTKPYAGGRKKTNKTPEINTINYTIVGDARKKVCPFQQGCRVSTWQTSRKRQTGCRLWTNRRSSETFTHSSSNETPNRGRVKSACAIEQAHEQLFINQAHKGGVLFNQAHKGCVLLDVSPMPRAILSVFSNSSSSEKKRVRLRVRTCYFL